MRRRESNSDGPAAARAGVDLQRRQISVAAALALLGGASMTLTACSGGGGSPVQPSGPSGPLQPTCPADSACGNVEGDPNHSATIGAAQLTAGGALILDITGNASHGHDLELSADEVVAIREKRRVQKYSSFRLSHQHYVTFN